MRMEFTSSMVCGYIRWVDDNVLNHVSEEKHARSLWNKLEQLYARKTGNNKLFLIKKMMSLKYQDGTPMTDHLNTFQGIINQLAGMNIKFEEEVQGLWLLGTLPDSWETFRTSLSNSAPDGIMNMDLVKSCVLNEEMRRKSQGSSSQSSVLVIEKRGRSKSRGPKNRDRSKSKTNKFANVECHYCHLKGHIKKYCRQLKRDMKQGKVKEKKNDNETGWVIDGASIHATPRKDFFTSYTSGDFGSVRMGNDGSLKPLLTRGSMVIAKGNKSSSLYLMRGKALAQQLGHMSEKGLMILAKKNLLSGMKKGSLKRCAHCLAGKQTRVAFKTLRHTRKPDDHSRKIWVYTLKTKDQVLDVFKQFHALVERQSGEKLKCIRTDNGGEYSGPFDEYCRQHGIRHQKTPPKTPQLNGLVERMNRTLVERVRCLLSQSQLPRSFWGEALNTVVHVLNLTPCVPLEFDVPDRIWSNNEISYDHLRVFGCKAFVHIPKDERSKLDAKTRPCVFIGYGQDELGYRFYDPVQKKLVRSRDVVFMEDHTIQDIEKTNPMESQHSSDLIDLDPVPLANLPTQVEDEAHDDQHDMGDVETPTQVEDEAHDDQHDMGDVEIPIQVEVDDDVHEQSPAAEAPSDIPLRRSTRDRHPSTRYSVDDYVLLSGGEHESYVEAMKDENKMKWVDAMRDEMESLHENHSFELQEEHTSQPRYKARLVVKGLDLEIQQMDVKTAFLHGDLDKEIYMEQPRKSLYGLKQAPRRWYKKFESVMGSKATEKLLRPLCICAKFSMMILIDNLKKQLSKSFAMKDLGLVKRILGIRIEQDRASKKLCMLQEQYIEKVLARFNMSKAKVVSSPLASHFKLSSRHSPSTNKEKEDMRRVQYASKREPFSIKSRRHHWEAIKWIMRYLRGTSKLKLTFGKTTKCVALSTTEAEYIAAEACKELLWMKCFMQELGFKQQRYVNSTYHARSKHIDVRYHWMRDALNDNLFEIEKIHTDNNGSDMLTKTLPREKLGVCCSIAGMISSNGRSRFVCGPIDLKFEGEFFNSLISNLNGGDRIWSSGRLLFQSVNSASLLLISSHPGSSDIQP
ncbi:hypothetical protein AAG906_021191 [Vitis piasezkii]